MSMTLAWGLTIVAIVLVVAFAIGVIVSICKSNKGFSGMTPLDMDGVLDKPPFTKDMVGKSLLVGKTQHPNDGRPFCIEILQISDSGNYVKVRHENSFVNSERVFWGNAFDYEVLEILSGTTPPKDM